MAGGCVPSDAMSIFQAPGPVLIRRDLFSTMCFMEQPRSRNAIGERAGGGPEDIVTLMEGESLLNDATAISLFQVFFTMVKNINPEQEWRGSQPDGTGPARQCCRADPVACCR